MIRPKTIVEKFALMGCVLGGVLPGPPAMADEIGSFKAQLDAITRKLGQLEEQQTTLESGQAKLATSSEIAVTGGDFPGTFKLPGTGTSIRVGGYAKLDCICDIGTAGGDSVDNLHSSAVYGHMRIQNNTAVLPHTVNKALDTAYIDLVWSPVPATNLGIKYIYARREAERGDSGRLSQLQIGAQHSF